ncbi:MAG: alpha/beta fold hydrolase [Spongiibacteraceae bacterium]
MQNISEEQFLVANDVRLCWQGFGDANKPCILLVMGLGTQMVAWSVDFCQQLADKGFYVIRFDNRDIGRSQKFDGHKTPGLASLMVKARLGLSIDLPYTLDDMADDTAALLLGLGIPQAHIVGCSMGGMIAQVFAASHAERCLSLTSIMSSSGNPWLPRAKPKATWALVRKRSSDPEQRLAQAIETMRIISSPGYPDSDEVLRGKVLGAYQRSSYIQDYPRHLSAVVASGDRRKLLKTISAPSLVIHGNADPLVPVASGVDTAKHLENAELEIIEGMGHSLPEPLWPTISDRIASFAANI